MPEPKDLGDQKKEETNPAIDDVTAQLRKFSEAEAGIMAGRNETENDAKKIAEDWNERAATDPNVKPKRSFLGFLKRQKAPGPEVVKYTPGDVLRAQAEQEDKNRDWDKRYEEIQNKTKLEAELEAKRVAELNRLAIENDAKRAQERMELDHEAATVEDENKKKEAENARRLEGMGAKFKPGDKVRLTAEAMMIFGKERPEDFEDLILDRNFVRGVDEDGNFSIECKTRDGDRKYFHLKPDDLMKVEKTAPGKGNADEWYRNN